MKTKPKVHTAGDLRWHPHITEVKDDIHGWLQRLGTWGLYYDDRIRPRCGRSWSASTCAACEWHGHQAAGVPAGAPAWPRHADARWAGRGLASGWPAGWCGDASPPRHCWCGPIAGIHTSCRCPMSRTVAKFHQHNPGVGLFDNTRELRARVERWSNVAGMRSCGRKGKPNTFRRNGPTSWCSRYAVAKLRSCIFRRTACAQWKTAAYLNCPKSCPNALPDCFLEVGDDLLYDWIAIALFIDEGLYGAENGFVVLFCMARHQAEWHQYLLDVLV